MWTATITKLIQPVFDDPDLQPYEIVYSAVGEKICTYVSTEIKNKLEKGKSISLTPEQVSVFIFVAGLSFRQGEFEILSHLKRFFDDPEYELKMNLRL